MNTSFQSTRNLRRAFVASKSAQRGVTNLQMAIYLVVAVIVVVGSLVGFKYISQSKASNDVAQWADLKANVVAHGSQVGAFTTSNMTTDILASKGFWPAAQVSGSAGSRVVKNLFQGSITAAVATVSTTGDAIAFTSTNYKPEECVAVGGKLEQFADKIVVGTTTVKAVGGAMNHSTLDTACNAASRATFVVTLTS